MATQLLGQFDRLSWMRTILAGLVFLAALVMLQPALWYPSVTVVGIRIQSTLATVDHRPVNPSIGEWQNADIDPNWIQSRFEFDAGSSDHEVVIAGFAEDQRVFVNGIMVRPGAAPSGPASVYTLPRHFLQDSANRLDIIYARGPATSQRFVALTQADAPAWRATLPDLAAIIRWLIAVTAFVLAAGHAALFARSERRADGLAGLTFLAVGLVAVPGVILDAFGAAFSPLVLALAVALPGLAVCAFGHATGHFRPGPGLLALAALFILAVFRDLIGIFADPAAPWSGMIDGFSGALAVTMLSGQLGRAIAAAGHTGFVWANQLRRTGAIIQNQKTLIEQQAETLASETRRRAILEERARFARDMHDGLGGSLLSLLVQVRNGDLPKEEVVAALEANIGDMRLMIDSLDQADRPLDAALSTFQTRIRPMFDAASIALKWSQPAARRLPALAPDDVLSLLRMLQESATNIIRHSGADLAEYRFDFDSEARVLRIEIRDNGSRHQNPKPGEAPPTSGLNTMRGRIETLGGAIEVGPGADTGWIIRASVPV